MLFKWEFYTVEMVESSEMIYENSEISSVKQKWSFNFLRGTTKRPKQRGITEIICFYNFMDFLRTLYAFRLAVINFIITDVGEKNVVSGFVIDLDVWFRQYESIFVIMELKCYKCRWRRRGLSVSVEQNLKKFHASTKANSGWSQAVNRVEF